MQLVSALLFSLPPPLGRNPQIGIKPNAPGGVELQMRGGLAWVVGRKEKLGEGGGARRIGVRGRGSLDGGMATNVQLYLMQIAT